MFCVSSMTRLCASIGVAGLLAMSSAQAATPASARYVVAFKSTAAAVAARQAIAQAGGKIKLELLGGDAVAVVLPKAKIAALKRNANISSIEEDVKRYPLAVVNPSAAPYAPGQSEPYGIRLVQADQLSDSLTGNRKVCIIDSGYGMGHEDLPGTANVSGDSDSGTGDWFTDENHHGTHVAGTIVGLNQANVGVVGVNPNNKLKLHIIKVFGADGWAYSSTLANAARKCAKAGANVISMSLGGPLPNKVEILTFEMLKKKGILSIAAAGNDGNTRTSYPAGYPAVMSVAAVDENKAHADFSQVNVDVEIAGPGVSVLSTVPMGEGRAAALSSGGTTYAPNPFDGVPVASVTKPLADFGFGGTVSAGSMTGKICVISRGNDVSFGDKVLNCQASGGAGAIVSNNAPGGFLGTLGEGVTAAIPAVSVSDTEGASLMSKLGQNATLAIVPTNYAQYDGTSMATPHVSAVAALVWSYFPACKGEQIRAALNATALDLGASGRDSETGYGLVQAKAAHDYLATQSCAR